MVQLDDGRETNLDLGYVIGRPAKPNQMRRGAATRRIAQALRYYSCSSVSPTLLLFVSLSLGFFLSRCLCLCFLLEAAQVEMQNNKMQMRLQLAVLEGVAIRTDICPVAAARWRLCATVTVTVTVSVSVCVASLLCAACCPSS